jgi:probable F420-dependent oxidoreductase
VKFGVAIFPTDQAISPPELGRMVEERGFESLFFPEHTHIPASRATPYPAGGDLPEMYWRTHDPLIGLASVASVTEKLKLATGICLVIERDPIITAKEVASLDTISNGRVLFGVGAGWNVEEMANHGTDASRRFGLLRERVEAMKAIWTQDDAEYHGKHVDFDPIWSWPKPVQKPHPPILLGGNGKGVLDRVLAFADEWMPNRVGDEEKLAARISKLQRRAREETDRDGVPVTLYGVPSDPAAIERYEQAGVHRCVYWLPPAGRDVVERELDGCAQAADAFAAAGA